MTCVTGITFNILIISNDFFIILQCLRNREKLPNINAKISKNISFFFTGTFADFFDKPYGFSPGEHSTQTNITDQCL